MRPLTEKQLKIFKFIEDRLLSNNPPSQREIAEHFGLAQNSIYQIVSYLRKKEYLSDATGHRGLRLSKEYLKGIQDADGIPIIGQVAAGEPIIAEENIEEYVNIRRLLSLSDDVFLLRVSGDSMIDEGIMDGDLVTVKPDTNIKNGQIAVVLLDDEATLKRVRIQKDRIALKPANKAAGYKTKYIKRNDKDIRIIGKVTGCLRVI
jgi:repressor LexA